MSHKVSLDLTRPSDVLKGHALLTIINYYSRFPEVFLLNIESSEEIILCLCQTFAWYDVLKSVVPDNGLVFVSDRFENLLASLGISHCPSANYNPQSNGTIERFHRTQMEVA